MNKTKSKKQNLTDKGYSLLGYIMELADDEELVNHVLPNLGFTLEESKAIVEGYFDNDERVVELFNELVCEVKEAVKDPEEIRNVFSNLDFTDEEMIYYEVIDEEDK